MTKPFRTILTNEVLHEVKKLSDEGKTYKEIKEITKVSDGTITRIKNGTILPNRKVAEVIEKVSMDLYKKLELELIEVRKSKLELEKRMYNSNNNSNEPLLFSNENIAFNQETFNKFISTEFGSKFLKWSKTQSKIAIANQKEELKKEYNEKYELLDEENRRLKEDIFDTGELIREIREEKRLLGHKLNTSQRPVSDINAFGSRIGLIESVKSLKGNSNVYGNSENEIKKVDFGKEMKLMSLDFDK